jgi:M6 family metalloprotease-like protein
MKLGALALALVAAGAARADFIDHFAALNDIGVLKVPRSGTTHILVIPVVIDNLPFEQTGGEQAFLDEANQFYAEDATGFAFTPFYTAMSNGRYHPVVTVADAVHFPSCPQLGTFQNCEIPRGAGIGEGDLSGAAGALGDALKFMDKIFQCASTGPSASLGCTSGGGVKFSDFDTSGPVEGTPDHVTDGVIILSNAGFPGIALPIDDIATTPLYQQLLGPLPSFVYDGVTVGAVAIAGRETLPAKAVFVSTHEFGHLLGWCDLYNENQTSTDMPYTLMGGWYYDTSGSYVDGFSRMAAAFAHVQQVAKSGTYTIDRSDKGGAILKVGTGGEFFTVELRDKADDHDGDMSVPFGVVVERVRLGRRPSPNRGQYVNTLQNCVNCTPFDTFLSIEQADGKFDLENDRPRNDADILFKAGSTIAPSTDTAQRSLTHQVFSTNKYDGEATGITITVSAVDADKATLDINVPDVADACSEIADYCGSLTCSNGECGGPATPPAPKPKPAAPTCACIAASSTSTTAGALAILGLVVAFGRRGLRAARRS